MTDLPGLLVDATWVRDRAGDDVVIADVRWVPGGSARDTFEAGHLPGAISLDLEDDLSRPAFDGPGRHPLPTPEAFAGVMAVAGIGDRTPVVAYDDAGGWVAARLWWLLHLTGHPVALLDLPSLDAWPGELVTGPAAPRPATTFRPRPWPRDRVMDAEEVRASLVAGTATLLDLRAGERYRGETEPIDPVAGHIPGAISAPWQGNREGSGGEGPMLRAAALRRRYEALGVRKGSRAIASCGSGVTGSFGVFAMELAGLAGAKLYEGSWSDWIHDPSRPVATGPEPGRLPG